MKNSNNPKNRPTAEPVDRKGNEKQEHHTTQGNDREHNKNNKEQVASFNVNRGYYSRNGGDNGYRGL